MTEAVPGAAPEVIFETRAATGGFSVGFARLNRARQLNAITLSMCEQMLRQFREWAADEGVVAVVLEADGAKGFSAGGDVASVVRQVWAGGAQRFVYGDSFFEVEYALDLLIHTYPKPFISFVHGVCMGGGVGLAVGASHRIVADNCKIAMPEIHIGLFPDVGGGWFLNRLPGNIGRVMALTGMIISEADALFAGLADYYVPEAGRQALWAELLAIPWVDQPAANQASVTRLMLAVHRRHQPELPSAGLMQSFDALRFIAGQADLPGLLAGLQAAASEDPYFEIPAASLANGSPTTALITDAYLRRTRQMSIAQVLALDLLMARQFQRHHDFLEGVRALLIDKDRQPRWEARGFAEVDPQVVARHFQPLQPIR
ncbi:MAG: enoyl-CoA hydratase/isomerase family protein [Burkholderiaceae bacterium]